MRLCSSFILGPINMKILIILRLWEIVLRLFLYLFFRLFPHLCLSGLSLWRYYTSDIGAFALILYFAYLHHFLIFISFGFFFVLQGSIDSVFSKLLFFPVVSSSFHIWWLPQILVSLTCPALFKIRILKNRTKVLWWFVYLWSCAAIRNRLLYENWSLIP